MLIQEMDILSEADFRQISEIVYSHCGINLHDGKKELVRARIAKRIRQLGLRDAGQYIRRVLSDPTGEELADMIDSLSTNLTSFFRENQHFDFLSRKLLPGLIQRRRDGAARRIRGWSAGCSTGEEACTIAITLLDALENEGDWDVKILATDISRRVLRTATAGVYERARLEAVSPLQKSRYFTPVEGGRGGAFSVGEAIRRTIRFRYLNLMEPWPFGGPFDFIFCRNVMIYFDKPTQERLVNRFWECLEPGGLLFTGHSESLTGVSHRFGYVQPTVYVKA